MDQLQVRCTGTGQLQCSRAPGAARDGGWRRCAQWPCRRRHERMAKIPQPLAPTRLRSSLYRVASTSQPWILIRGIISEEERLCLLKSAERQRADGLLLANPAGPHRFFRKLDATGGADALIEDLTRRLEQAMSGLCGRPRDNTLGRVCSWIEPGGFIHEHRDRYTSPSGREGFAHLRANIVVQMDRCGVPLIAGKPLPVEPRDAWAFLASHELHSTDPIRAPKARIVYGFGWSVPDSFGLQVSPSWG